MNEDTFSEAQYKEFFEYHKNNPMIWKAFKNKAFEAIKRGFKHYGSKGIFELIRWEDKGQINKDGFKVNNLYTPYYARLFSKEFPQYKDFFRTRKIKK